MIEWCHEKLRSDHRVRDCEDKLLNVEGNGDANLKWGKHHVVTGTCLRSLPLRFESRTRPDLTARENTRQRFSFRKARA